MFYVYVLSCNNNNFYVGYSSDLKKRITKHKKGLVISTKNRLPISLIYYECFISKKDAKAREIYLKSGAGKDQLASILKETINKIS